MTTLLGRLRYDGGAAAVGLRLPSISGVEVVLVRLAREAAIAADAAACLSPAERQAARRFSDLGVARRYAAGRARLRQLLGQRLGVDARQVELAEGAHGKPALCGASAASRLHFNVAHAGDVTAYVFAVGREVGVDIEVLRPCADADAVVDAFFSPSERAAYHALDICQRQRAFLDGWTRKEAFVKALGRGLQLPFPAFDVTLAPGVPAQLLRVGGVAGAACGWTLHSLAPGAGLVGALVVEAVRP